MTKQEKNEIIAKFEELVAKNKKAGKSTALLDYLISETKAGNMVAPKRMI
jgi:hypothetical protein